MQEHPPTTVGSRSTYIALGTWRPELPVLKNVLNWSSQEFSSKLVSSGTPSGPIPCSRQKSSQQAFPIWTPAWPTWIEMHSLWTERSQHSVTFTKKEKQLELIWIGFVKIPQLHCHVPQLSLWLFFLIHNTIDTIRTTKDIITELGFQKLKRNMCLQYIKSCSDVPTAASCWI